MQLLIPWLFCVFAKRNFLVAGVTRNQDIPFCLFYVFSVYQLSILRVQQRLGRGSWDKMSCIDYAGVFLFILVFDCEQSLTFLLCHSKRSGARVRGERRSPIISLFRSTIERSSDEGTMKNDRSPSVVLMRHNIIRDESSKST